MNNEELFFPTKWPESTDSVHKVIRTVHLRANGVLHRFRTKGGELWSGIYVGNKEMCSCNAEDTEGMIRWWNESHSIFSNIQEYGARLTPSEDGFLMLIEGSLKNDEPVWAYWNFAPDEINLVVWLAKQYQLTLHEKWVLNATLLSNEKARRLFKQYLPKDSNLSEAHVVNQVCVMAFEDGQSTEVDVSGCRMPDVGPLYEKYCKY